MEHKKHLQDGKVLTALILFYNSNKTRDSYAAVLGCLADDPLVWVPMNMQISESDILQFLGSKTGDSVRTLEDIRLKPDILKNRDGKLFFPVFTMTEEVPDRYRKNFSWVQQPFKEAMRFLSGRHDLEAVVINAFSKSIIIPVPIINMIMGEVSQKKTQNIDEITQLYPVGREGYSLKKHAIEFCEKHNVSKAYLAKKLVCGKQSYVFAIKHAGSDSFFEQMRQYLSSIHTQIPIEVMPYSALKTKLKNTEVKMFYISKRRISDKIELFRDGYGYFTSERDDEGIVGALNIHLGKPYCGYYRIYADGAVALLLHLQDKYGIKTLETSLREFARQMSVQRIKEGITIRDLDQEGEYMWALMDKFPKLMDSLGIYYEEHMYFD